MLTLHPEQRVRILSPATWPSLRDCISSGREWLRGLMEKRIHIVLSVVSIAVTIIGAYITLSTRAAVAEMRVEQERSNSGLLREVTDKFITLREGQSIMHRIERLERRDDGERDRSSNRRKQTDEGR